MLRNQAALSTSPKRSRLRPWLLAALVLLIGSVTMRDIATQHAPGCDFYRPASGRLLIAHAAGGLPDRKYPNNIAALDLSYVHGLRYFEMDFHQLPFGAIRSGHDVTDLLDPRGAWISQVIAWMRRHPGTYLLPDMKTDNIAGLRQIAEDAPDLKNRIIPFVYHESQYDAVRALGFHLPVYALFRDNRDADWLAFANSHAFWAVAVAKEHIDQIPAVRHPVIVFTYDVMVKAPGARAVITNCMVPARPQA